MKLQEIEFANMTPHCGAEVRGIDLSRPLDKRATKTLTNALVDHGVLFFRDQRMTPGQQKLLGRYFGDLHIRRLAWLLLPTRSRPGNGRGGVGRTALADRLRFVPCLIHAWPLVPMQSA